MNGTETQTSNLQPGELAVRHDSLTNNAPRFEPAALTHACSSCAADAAGSNSGTPLNRSAPVPSPWVYAIGSVEPHHASHSLEKEFKQAMARAGSAKTA